MTRYRRALIVAFALAALLVGTHRPVPLRPAPKRWSEVCRFITPDNPFWLLFLCDVDPPPKDPST